MILLTFLLITFISYLILHLLTMRPKNFPPGPPLLPYIGSFYHAKMANIHKLVEKWKLNYGPLIGFIMHKRKYVIVSDPPLIMEVFKRPEFQGRTSSFIRNIVFKDDNKGIFFNEGPSWTDNRRFVFRHLRDYGFNKESVIEDEYMKWRQYTLKKGNVHEAMHLFKYAASNVLWRSVTGEPLDYDDPLFDTMTDIMFVTNRGGTPFGIVYHDIFPILAKIAPNWSKYNGFVNSINKLQDYFQEIINKHKTTLDPDHPRDLIDAYLIELDKGRKTFTEVGLVIIVFDLLIPTSDGLAATISFLLLYMIHYPEIQKKVQEEIDQVLGENQFSLRDRIRLPYCEAVINEVARMNTIAPMGILHKATQDTTLGNYFIPKNTDLLTSIYSLLQDKNHWGDPENFRPERFINKNGQFIRDEWLLYFGQGRRVCVGESFARNFQHILFVSLLQDFHISIPEGDPLPSLEHNTGFAITHLPFRVKFIPRRKLFI